MSDDVPMDWLQRLARTQPPPDFETTLRLATNLVRDGVKGVTVIVPRAPGVLPRARDAAQVAGVSVRAHNVGSATITMRFFAESGNSRQAATAQNESRQRSRRARSGQGWSRFFKWRRRGARQSQ